MSKHSLYYALSWIAASLGALACGSSQGDEAGSPERDEPTRHSGACEGSFQVLRGEQLASIEECTSISGDLELMGLSGPEAAHVNFADLESIGGHLEVTLSGQLTSLAFPRLSRVQGAIQVFANSALTEINLPELATVGEGFTRGNNTTRFNFEVFRNPDLTALSIPKLTRVGGFLQISDSAASALEFPRLTTTGHLELSANTELTEIHAPQLEGSGLQIVGDTSLQELSLPALVEAFSLEIKDNTALGTLDLPLLERVTFDFAVINNPELPTCQVQAVLEQLTQYTGTPDIQMNAEEGVCP